jgi:hypothetical protein
MRMSFFISAAQGSTSGNLPPDPPSRLLSKKTVFGSRFSVFGVRR